MNVLGFKGATTVSKILALGILTIMLLAVPASAQDGSNIVPGQEVAGIRLGGPVNEAIAMLGDLVDKTERGSYVLYDWPLRPLLVIAEKSSGKIVLVLVQLTDAYRTEHAITAGSDRQAVEKAYGKEFISDENQRSTTLVYDGLGIAFDIGKLGVMSDRVTSIFVFLPGQWKKITGEL